MVQIDEDKSKQIQENSVLLMISFRMPGMRRSVNKSDIADKNNANADDFAVTIDSDTEMVNVSKSILTSPEFKDVASHYNGIKRALSRVGFRAVFKEGCFLIPTDTLNEIDYFIEKKIKEGEVLVEKFLKAYPKQKQEAKRLRALYDEADYPSVEELKGSFGVTKRYFTFDTPGRMKDINMALYEKEKKKTESFWAETATKIDQALIESFNGLVTHAVGKLSGDGSGGKKVFTDSAMKRIEDFLAVFDKRNVSKNADLAAIMDKARKVVKGLDATAVQNEGQVGISVKEGFEQVKRELDKLMVRKPGRKIRLDL